MAAIFLIAGCATTTGSDGIIAIHDSHWRGRLALRMESPAAQSFSANFELRGSALAGNLVFTSPLGNTLAQLQWGEQLAMLQTTGAPQYFESLSALVHHATGTDLPIASLFSWLQGKDAPTPEWEADLRELSAGRLSARRTGSDAPVTLKIILDR